MVHVRISTGFELIGFGFLDAAAWHVNKITGLTFSGLVLLFIGYVFEDDKALLALKKQLLTLKSALKRKKTGDK